MSMRGVLRVGEVAIRVMDMSKSRVHYGDRMGLHEVMEDAQGRVYYKCWDEHDHHSIVLVPSDRPGMDYFAFRVHDDATLTTLAPKIEAFGLKVRHIPAGFYPKSGRRIEFVLPSGHTMQLYAHKEQVGNTLGLHNPGVVPDDGVIRLPPSPDRHESSRPTEIADDAGVGARRPSRSHGRRRLAALAAPRC